MGLSSSDPFIESSHLDVTDFGFYERYVKILKDKKLIIIRFFGENFGLFQKSLTNKRKNWVELSHSAIANWETTEQNKKQQRNFYISTKTGKTLLSLSCGIRFTLIRLLQRPVSKIILFLWVPCTKWIAPKQFYCT